MFPGKLEWATCWMCSPRPTRQQLCDGIIWGNAEEMWAREVCLALPKGVVEFLIIKPTRCTNFSNLFLKWNSKCFGQFLCPSSGVFHCTHSNGICHTRLLTAASCQQTCMTYTIAVCTVYSVLLMMDKGTVRNMKSFISKINLKN